MTISLADLTPYEPQPMALIRHAKDCAKLGSTMSIASDSGNASFPVCIYRSDSGNVDASLRRTGQTLLSDPETWDADVFFTFPKAPYSADPLDDATIYFFNNLLGHSGFYLTYNDGISQDYYYLTDEGVPYLLAQTQNTVASSDSYIDLDGDGEEELCASGETVQLFFRRDGKYYEADVEALVKAAWPEMGNWSFPYWDFAYSRLYVTGYVRKPEWGPWLYEGAVFTRYLYFDGENLLLYKPEAGEAVDHVLGNPQGVPQTVVNTAKAVAQEAYQDYLSRGENADAQFDDWRVEAPEKVWSNAYPQGSILVYTEKYTYHAANPAGLQLTGSARVDEDGWYEPDNTWNLYLYFMEQDGLYTYLNDQYDIDITPPSATFDAEMQRLAVELGLASVEDARPQDILNQLSAGASGRFLTQLSGMGETERQFVCQQLNYLLEVGSETQKRTYLDAMQTMAWYSYAFDDAQKDAYDDLLEHVVRASRGAQEIQTVMDAMTTGDAVRMNLSTADGVGGGPYLSQLSPGSGDLRAPEVSRQLLLGQHHNRRGAFRLQPHPAKPGRGLYPHRVGGFRRGAVQSAGRIHLSDRRSHLLRPL